MEPPKDTESYIHRSGRTARAGKSGTCITLFNRRNREFLDRVEDLAGIRMEMIQVPSDQEISQIGGSLMGNKRSTYGGKPSSHMNPRDLIMQHGDPEKAIAALLA